MTEDWTGWTSTASSVEKVASLDGELEIFKFLTISGTVFDQQTLTCNFPEDAFPCEESPSLYGAVEFGKIQDDYDY